MKLGLVALVLALEGASAFQFQAGRSWSRRSTLRMVAAPEKGTLRSKIELRDDEGKLKNKVEQIKVESDGLREPLLTEMTNDEIFISHVRCLSSTTPPQDLRRTPFCASPTRAARTALRAD